VETDRTLTMTELVDVFERAIRNEENYIGVRIKYPNTTSSKFVIFANEDFETALESFKITYNNDLSHTLSEDIKITGFMYGYDFAEIQDLLVYDNL
jgi:hypothetical protein